MALIIVLIVATSLSVLLMLAFMSRENYIFGLFKMLASTGFILLCIHAGGIYSPYGWAILAGLICSWWGDVFLISKSPIIFMLGLVAFFLAHVAYIFAFTLFGAELYPTLIALALLALPGLFIVHWLYPYLGKMRVPVLSYMIVITVMVALAGAAFYSSGRILIPLGAVAFYCSDIFVARERFVCESKANGYIGLPMYYAAQILLAVTPIYAW